MKIMRMMQNKLTSIEKKLLGLSEKSILTMIEENEKKQLEDQYIQLYRDMRRLDDINERINKEYCKNTDDSLSDESLLEEIKKSPSVLKQKKQIEETLAKYGSVNDNLVNDLLNNFIPAGTKGVIRGNKFNKIVQDYIDDLKLDEKLFEIKFERKCDDVETSEIPDWYIKSLVSKKVLIGMNQIDLC